MPIRKTTSEPPLAVVSTAESELFPPRMGSADTLADALPMSSAPTVEQPLQIPVMKWETPVRTAPRRRTTPRRILLLSEIIPPAVGGTARYPWEILRRLNEGSVVVVGGEYPGGPEFDATQRMAISRLPIDMRETGMLRWGGMKNYYRLARHVLRICKAKQVDAIWCARCVPEGWVAYVLNRLTGIPYFLSAHGEEVKLPEAGCTRGVMTSRQHRFMARRVLDRAAGIIANSQNTLRIVRDEWGIPEAKMKVLYPGVDTNTFQPAELCPDTRRALGWEGRKVLLTIGRLVKRKGQDQMIMAMERIRQDVPNVLYAIVGEGEERQRLETLVAERGLQDCVRFHGEINDGMLLKCYQQCDLFVLPNRQVGTDLEGFGMVLIEAQACGKPVIAGNSGGTAETMRAPHTGLVVDCTRPEPLAAAVLDLMRSPTRLAEMGEAGRNWVLNRFDWNALVERAEQLIDGIPLK